jgi:GntR family transcriptional repressor for pyruvate dehydrogenase complex
VIKELSTYITRGILEGNIKVGDQLASERDLSEMLSVGRSTLREATKVLTMMGLLEVRTGQGTFITNGHSDFYAAPLSWGLIIGEKSTKELFEARSLLDCEAAYYAAQRITDDELERLSGFFQEMQNARAKLDIEKLMAADVSFHMMIAEAAHNNVIFQMLKTIRNLLEVWIRYVFIDEKSMEDTTQEHERIFNSIVNKDPAGARDSMRYHISAGYERLQKVLNDLAKNTKENKNDAG